MKAEFTKMMSLKFVGKHKKFFPVKVISYI